MIMDLSWNFPETLTLNTTHTHTRHTHNVNAISPLGLQQPPTSAPAPKRAQPKAPPKREGPLTVCDGHHVSVCVPAARVAVHASRDLGIVCDGCRSLSVPGGSS